MKIAVNTRLLVPEKMDGIARFSYEILQIITRSQPHVDFTFIFDRTVDERQFQFPKNVRFVSLSPPARHPILWYIWFEIRLKQFINKNQFDLFLSPEGWIPPQLKCKSLGVIHDLNFEHYPENIIWSHRKYLQFFFPRFAQRASRIATVSEYSKQDIVNTYTIPKSNIDVVYNGANQSFFPLPPEEIVKTKAKYNLEDGFFLFIGTLHPRKNLEHLFLSFDKFKKKTNSPLKLAIAGNKKWWPQKLDNIFQSLAHKNDIIFLGRLNDTELNEVLNAATALTYLPYFEGFGIPILEAFQTNTPVITANVTSMPEVAKGAALLCNPRSVEEIALALEKISHSEEQQQELVAKGKLRAKDFSWQKSANLLWNSIQNTLSL